MGEDTKPSTIVQTVFDFMHTGDLTADGTPSNTRQNPFVENTLIAEYKDRMSWAMVASIEPFFITRGTLVIGVLC